MKFGKSLSIRWHLLLLLLALALPFVAYLLVSSARQAAYDSELAGEQMLGVARLTAARLDDHIGDIRQVLVVLAGVVDPRVEQRDANDALLRSLATRLPPQVSNLSVWTPAGVNAGTLDPRVRQANLNVARRKFFTEALHTTDMAVDAPVTSSTTGRLIGIFAMRIERNGQVVGVVAVTAQLAQLQDLLAHVTAIPKGSLITVTDESGIVLARSIDPEKWIGKNVLGAAGGVRQSLRLREGIRNGKSADGLERIAGFTMASRMPWLVYVGVPTDVALAPVRTRLYENLMAGAAMLAIGFLLAVWVAHRISSRLRQLGADAAMLEAGDLAHRSGINPGGEIGALAATLNRMAEALQQRNASLEASQDRLRMQAEHDHLTGLPNRALFLDRLNVAIARAERSQHPLGLLFLDIDHFKKVNDTLGHQAGDQLLRDFASRLKTAVRNSDTVARFAGDEFTVILESLGSDEDARRIASVIVEQARQTVMAGEQSVTVSASIGVAMFAPGESAAAFIHRADEALYEAKREGRDRFSCAASVARA
ncbi:MAG: sensor diguanylate cyclase [Rhodoferax sp.]|nr:sensor diguanylate cyclase [Rhodoferax sp.]